MRTDMSCTLMMKCLSLTIFCLLLYADMFSQNIENYVRESVVKIDNIDTLSNNYDDLKDISNAIGNAQVVMLGEQDHGDAPTFMAKTRLVKYLHEKKGFNVLAFESDFYALTRGWEKTNKQTDSIQHFLKKNIFSLWTYSDAAHYLFNTYIPNSLQSNNPLKIAGFDSQFHSDYSLKNLKDDLNLYLIENKISDKFSDETTYKKFIYLVQKLIDNQNNINNSFDGDMRKELEVGLQLIKKEQLNKSAFYWALMIDNLIADNNWSTKNRDQAMANNLKYLVDSEYKGEKIIVWAANTHVMKYTDQLKSKAKFFNEVIFENMGTKFSKDSLKYASTYVIGFSSYKGEAGRLGTKQFSVEVPNKNGLENWIPDNIDYGFVDFKTYNINSNYSTTPFLMKGPMHYTIPARIVKIPWNLVYDGVFFIRNMYATKMIN